MSLYLLTYLCVAVFVVAAGLKVYKQFTLPVHLRWELYPVKHEHGKKADYGGSYLEESNWWEKERKSSLYNEAKFMIPEILFVRGLYEENKSLWNVSFPFHFGLYMLLGTFGLLVLGAVSMVFGAVISPAAGWYGQSIYYLTILLGFIGLTLGTLGCVGLLVKRISDPDLKAFSSFSEYFNLIFFLVFFAAALGAWLFVDHSFVGARIYVYGLITFGGVPAGIKHVGSTLGAFTVIMASLVTAYVPLTHMSHMFMKYFMYHHVRWQDEPSMVGSKLEAKVMENLSLKPNWSAPHIGADGNKTWVEISITKPEDTK